MAYTVKKLSLLSGVTIRTLHYYEEEGILTPAYYGENGYRYYEEKQLLQLQQILFFKELGFKIKQIKKIVGKDSFNQLSALYSHKQAIQKEWDKLGKLLHTIDKTIKHLKGKHKMKDQDFFDGFNLVNKAKGGESYFSAEALVLESVRAPSMKKESPTFYEQILQEAQKVYKKIVLCLEKGMPISSKEVQGCIQKHYEYINKFHRADKKVYTALAQLYEEHPDFINQLNQFHIELSPYISKAMRLFAKESL